MEYWAGKKKLPTCLKSAQTMDLKGIMKDMSHGEDFREISHEKETHKQFRRIFHARCPPPTPCFFSFLLLPRGLMAEDRP